MLRPGRRLRPAEESGGRTGTDRGWLRRVKRAVVVPDSYADWIPIARRWIVEQSHGDFDLVVAIANPRSDLLAGVVASRRLNIPLVAIYHDPWTLEETPRKSKMRAYVERKLEERVLRQSRRAVFCTDATRKAYLAAFACLSENNTSVCHFGYDASDFDYGAALPEQKDKLTLVYGGRIVPGQRDITALLDALVLVHDEVPVQLDIFPVGSERYVVQEVTRRGLGSAVAVLPAVASGTFRARLRRYDLLVLLGNSSLLQVPGKLYEYLGSRRPVLMVRFGAAKGTETEQLVERANSYHIVDGDPLAISGAIRTAWSQKQNGLLADTPEMAIADLEWHRQGELWRTAILGALTTVGIWG
jgi:glycosyltransferase involved in cell wall biosynthesis